MTKNRHVCAIYCRPEVTGDVISGENVNTTEGSALLNFEAANISSFRDISQKYGMGQFDGPPVSSYYLPIETYGISLIAFELLSWLQKRFRPSEPETMTNTTSDAAASSSGKNQLPFTPGQFHHTFTTASTVPFQRKLLIARITGGKFKNYFRLLLKLMFN